MTNRSLRERFGLAEHQTAVASHIITATQAAGFIKPDGALTSSKRYARYVPFWA
jgi:ATP-dependent DNA helicase RecG